MDKSLFPYVGGIVRIVTSILGAWLAQNGLGSEADAESMAGAAVLVATGVWSIWAKRKALLTPPPAK